MRRRAIVASWGVILGLLLFNVGWFVAGLLERSGYSPLRDDISELSALTASHAWLMDLANGLCGASTIAFALLGLRTSLVGVRGAGLSAAMVAFSAFGLDTLSDAFFRLDCQTVDGCTQIQEISSWHGIIHAVVGVGTLLVLMVGPYVVARSLRRSPAWSDLARWSIGVGVAIDLAVACAFIPDKSGLAQRALLLEGSLWVAALAVRTLRIARTEVPQWATS